jgi:hypothetical protein
MLEVFAVQRIPEEEIFFLRRRPTVRRRIASAKFQINFAGDFALEIQKRIQI